MQNTTSTLTSVVNFLKLHVPHASDFGAFGDDEDEVNGPSFIGFDNASIHIHADMVRAIKDHCRFGISLASHSTRLCMGLDNGFNRRFGMAFKRLGGIALMGDQKSPRWKLCSVIHGAWKETTKKMSTVDMLDEAGTVIAAAGEVCAGELEMRMTGFPGMDPGPVLRRLEREGRTLASPDGWKAAAGKSVASAVAAAKHMASPAVQAKMALLQRLSDRVLQSD